MRVRQAPSARNTASQATTTTRPVPCDMVTVAPRPPPLTCTGLKCASAWLRTPSRALPSELMLAISGLATSCHPISAVIAAGFEVVSDAKPTATTQTTPVDEQREAEPVEDQGGARRREVGGERERADQDEHVSGDHHRPADGQGGGNARREQRQTRAARHDEVAEDTRRCVARPGLDADQDRGERTEEQAEQPQAVGEAGDTAGR